MPLPTRTEWAEYRQKNAELLTTMETLTTGTTPRRKRLPRRDRGERFISRRELGERWSISVREIIEREKRGVLKPHRFSYKMVRFRLSDVIAVEEAAKVD